MHTLEVQIITLSPWCNVNATSPSLNSEALSFAERHSELAHATAVRLHALASQSLEAHPKLRRLFECGRIGIETAGDTLVLKGCLPSYYLKQVLQEALRRIEGVASIENQIVVVYPSRLMGSG
jgi:hypothetical protein